MAGNLTNIPFEHVSIGGGVGDTEELNGAAGSAYTENTNLLVVDNAGNQSPRFTEIRAEDGQIKPHLVVKNKASVNITGASEKIVLRNITFDPDSRINFQASTDNLTLTFDQKVELGTEAGLSVEGPRVLNIHLSQNSSIGNLKTDAELLTISSTSSLSMKGAIKLASGKNTRLVTNIENGALSIEDFKAEASRVMMYAPDGINIRNSTISSTDRSSCQQKAHAFECIAHN